MAETKSQTAYRKIREMITGGTLKEDEIYSENRISELLGMSRTPVRDAIRMLEAEETIEVFRGIGIRLRPVSSMELYELYPLRFMMEAYALQESIRYIPADRYDFFIGLWEKLKERIAAGEDVRATELRDLDRLTHMLFVEYSGNGTLRQLIDQLELKIDRFRTLMSEITDDDLDTADQHIEILKRMKEGNLQEAVALMEMHLYRPWKELFDRKGIDMTRLRTFASSDGIHGGKE